MLSFTDLGLSVSLAQEIKSLEITTPTLIQQKAIPVILEGKDVLACAQTGTGKTAAFGLPLIHLLMEKYEKNEVKSISENMRSIACLVVVPTRELAQQVSDALTDYAGSTPLKIAAVYGGVSLKPQRAILAQGVDILIATPGRLLDHLYSGVIDLKSVTHFVIDEADRMLDLGFTPDLNRIMRQINSARQSLLFSATFSKQIYAIANRILIDPSKIEIEPSQKVAQNVEQMLYPIVSSKRSLALSYLIGSNNWQQVLVFVKTKQNADELVGSLKKDGLKAASIHGDKSQGARERVLEQFKSGMLRILVATDIAARGLDISQLPVVINYQLPFKAEDYVHRIGRTGRAGMSGKAISFMTEKERYLLEAIESLLDIRIPQSWLAGFEPTASIDEEVYPRKRLSKSAQKRQLKKRLKI